MSKRLPWFRMYTDFLTDPKMIALAFEDQRHFIGVLALKSDGAIDDVADEMLLNRIVAQRLWIDHSVITEVKRRLVSAGLIDPNWQPVAWGKRQQHSDVDGTAAQRQKRFRERNALRNASGNEHGNATVTRLELEVDKEKDKENKPPNPLSPCGEGGESVTAEKPKRERKTRTSLKTFVEQCVKSGEKPISEYRPLQEYVQATGLPMEFVQLCWTEFKGEFMPGGSKAARLQADWRGHFLNFVKKGYYRLWYAKPDGTFELSTAGIQSKSFHNREVA